MKLKLTNLVVKNLSLPPIGQVTYWDKNTPGFGVRCSTRSKSYVVMFGERRRLQTLGRYPDLGLSEARKQAKFFQVTQVQERPTKAEFDYHNVVAEYLHDCRQRLRKSTLEGYALYLDRISFNGPISKITQGDVLKAVSRFTSSPSSQNYAFTTFKAFFNWAVRRQYLDTNPLGALKRPNKTISRNRVLSDDELGELLDHTLEQRGRFCDIVSLLVFTGQRRSEIALLQWSETNVDFLTLSPDRTKNKREHVVPLGIHALELLNSIEGGNRFVFGTLSDDKPYNGWSRANRRLRQATGIEPFTLHDLRRTYSTVHARIGTPIHVTEKLLNHASGTISGVAAVYNRHSYLEEMKQAVAAFDEYIAKLISG